MITNLLLTGPPSAGKTTVIKKVIAALASPANGFYTEEERVEEKRVGFLLHTLEGKTGYLAHQEIESDFSIRRYGVSIENIDTIAVPSIKPTGDQLIILDEIGKMECFSETFVEGARKSLDSLNLLLGTITYGHRGFIQEVKERPDVEVVEVTEENRDLLPAKILKRLEEQKNQW